MDMRKKYQEEFIKRHGIKLGFMSPFLKASLHTLSVIPQIRPDLLAGRPLGHLAGRPLGHFAAWNSLVELTVTLLQATRKLTKWKLTK
jgi:hypothetical protein